ncbi:Hypothetical Protein FCC1311_056842 [Hondaea fermentalgiana]|uniref:Limonene-1,2-epoxide hydrolase domain-containing protein n=1 Tax=Hondaea fermentalgiana TaxID=2315210 RepID=A0A2R5GLG4_9STRA|nr:Hypothetical Protein FCC1311_056842 [Hondaea fermentalgiana]|eukprot:GBG29463.1 Hypothetical Protein FCC1311_056842 [Hondaea fermentalgiana]
MRWSDIDADLTLSGGSTKIACPVEVVKAFLLAQSYLTTLKFARNGSLVFVERIDNFLINGTWLRIPICGYFKVCQGKIEFWKDYWDYCRYKEFVRNTFGKGASMRAALAQDQIVTPSASAS